MCKHRTSGFVIVKKWGAEMNIQIAVASSDGKVVNQHFGRAQVFYIIGADTENRGALELKEIRQVCVLCESGDHNEDRLKERVEQLSDCDYILVSRIGIRAVNAVEARGIGVFEIPGIINESIAELLDYLELQSIISSMEQQGAEEVT